MSARTLLMAAAAAGPPGASLNLSFMSGALDARLTFTRASTGTYFDANGTLQTAAINAPRWEYAAGTLRGLLIEDQRQNLWLWSADASNAAWTKGGTAGAPAVTANQIAAPDGTLTAARVVYPAVSAGAYSNISQGPSLTSAQYTHSVWLRGSVGGEQLYLNATADAVTYYRTLATLTTAWQRFAVTTPTISGGWFFQIGTDLRDAGQTAKPTQTIYVWGGQLEAGNFASSYIPTTTVAVTRSQDICRIPPANMGFFASPGGSWAAGFILLNPANAAAQPRIVGPPTPGGGGGGTLLATPTLGLQQFDGAVVATANVMVPNAISKGASTWAPGTGRTCLNAGAIASGAMATGYATLVAGGVALMNVANPGLLDNASGYMRSLRYWPRVLSDTEMQSATS